MITTESEKVTTGPFLRKRKRKLPNPLLSVHELTLFSESLGKKLRADVYLPNGYDMHVPYPSLLINDGQEMGRLDLSGILSELFASGTIPPIAAVAIHADKNRHEEYGTAQYPDYKNRGKRAAAYSRFITLELVPFLKEQYGTFQHPGLSVFAGFSLGGLSALDISWRNPDLFTKVGVFSGSLWWRYKPFNKKDGNQHRIMHRIIRQGIKREGMQFWFESGTKDESHDRNGSGTIDAVEDTRDLIKELKNIGYSDKDITFRLVKGGEHNYKTWRKEFPGFLVWAFGDPARKK